MAAARPRTAAGRGPRAASSRRRPRAGPPRSPRARRRRRAPSRLHRHRAGEDQVAALGLDAGDLAALRRASCRRSARRARRAPCAVEQEALDAERRHARPRAPPPPRGCAPCRRCRPAARRRCPRRGSQPAVASSSARCARSALSCLRLTLVAGQEALGHAHRAERPRAHVARLAVVDVGELHRAAAEVERDAVGERGRVDRGEVAVARLLLGREHLDLEPRALARGLSGTPAGWSRRGSPRWRPGARRRSPWRGRSGRTARSSRARAPSAPAAARRPRRGPSPTRTASWISSVRRHQPWPPCSPQVNTTRRNEFDPRSITARRRSVTGRRYSRCPPARARSARSARPGSRRGRARSRSASRPRAPGTEASRARCPGRRAARACRRGRRRVSAMWL